MTYPWQTTAVMGFKTVPVLRALWTPEFKRKYLRDVKLTSIRNNLYRIREAANSLNTKANL